MKILVTGAAGFIGSNLVERLLQDNFKVVGVDNFNNYYDPDLKEKNIIGARNYENFKLYREDVLDFATLKTIFKKERPEKIIHLAAKAGVRSSIKNPLLYAKVNVKGTVNLLKLSVGFGVKQFILGSSSSVYGNSRRLPFSENDPCNKIISPYGASKRAAELWVECFYRTYGLKSVILRFFTVYGPRGRPDMAPALFTKALLEGKLTNQYGDGSSSRDYTYIDDIIGGIYETLEKDLDFEIINLGNNNPIKLREFIKSLEKIIKRKAKIQKMPTQSGDVEKTWANIVKAKELLGWKPKTRFEKGLNKYVLWLKKRMINIVT